MREPGEPQFFEGEEQTLEEEDVREGRIHRDVVGFLVEVFRNSETDRGRIELIRKRVNLLFQNYPGEQGNLAQKAIERQLVELEGIESEEEFIEQGLKILAPALRLYKQDPRGMETAQREAMRKRLKFERLNKIFLYGIEGSTLHLHLAPAHTERTGEFLEDIRDGVKQLAALLEEHPEITSLEAISPLIARHGAQNLLKRAGFTVTGEVSSDVKNQYFPGEQESVWGAFASRDQFLKVNRKL